MRLDQAVAKLLATIVQMEDWDWFRGRDVVMEEIQEVIVLLEEVKEGL